MVDILLIVVLATLLLVASVLANVILKALGEGPAGVRKARQAGAGLGAWWNGRIENGHSGTSHNLANGIDAELLPDGTISLSRTAKILRH
jgi:hypothetical protein